MALTVDQATPDDLPVARVLPARDGDRVVGMDAYSCGAKIHVDKVFYRMDL